MSMSPDDPSFLQSLLGPNGSLSSGMNSPLLGIAMGLLQAGGPSRMPTSFGQALGQGMQTGQQFQSQGLQNAMQRLMMGQNIAKMQYMLGGPGMSTADAAQPQPSALPPQPQGDSSQVPAAIGTSQAASTQGVNFPSQNPAQTVDTTKITPQQMVTAPATYSDPMKDPYYNYLAGGARIGLPGWDTLAGQRQQFLLAQPGFQAAQERAKAEVTPVRVNQGGGVYIPGQGMVFQLPKLPTGATIDAAGNVSMAPGSLPAIGQSEQASAQGSLFGKPTTVQTPSGSEIQTTVGNAMFPSQVGGTPGNVAKLSPAVTSGMTETGKQATERANQAIEKQPASQQTIGQLGQLEANLSALGASPGKQTQLDVKNSLASVGGFLGFPGLANADLTNAAAARKTIVNLTAPMVRSMGAREPFQMVSFIRDGMASINNPSDANAIVIGMLRGLAEYQNATGKYAGDFLNKNNGTGFAPGQGAWDATWQKQADPTAFIMENLPPFEQQSILQAAQKNPALMNEIKRAAQSQKIMKQMGYIQDNPNE